MPAEAFFFVLSRRLTVLLAHVLVQLAAVAVIVRYVVHGADLLLVAGCLGVAQWIDPLSNLNISNRER